MSQLGVANRSVEVFILDTFRAAAAALDAHRPGAESTHILCRHADEASPVFTARVLRRMTRIQTARRIRSLWYVVGADSSDARRSMPLLDALLEMLKCGSSLTVVGPGTHQAAVFEWLDSLTRRRRPEVTVGARLYSDADGLPSLFERQPVNPAAIRPMARAGGSIESEREAALLLASS